MPDCFDALKRPIPCPWQPVVRVPEPAGELLVFIAILGVLLLVLSWQKRKGREW